MAIDSESAFDEVDELCVNTIRTLSIDAIQKANSGHPGTPMALAPVAYTLWQRFLRFDPDQPIWPNRDRFVLSAGHASMLLYALLHLAGVKAVDPDYEIEGRLSITLDDIERFRQLDSKAAGHPEYRWASGVETTTGPLGQGVATSVGMALASKWQAEHFNKPGFEIFDFDVYVVAGDGCLMEGVSHEAASFAGHQQLDNLCWIYDNNHISIDGSTEITLSDDPVERFEAYGWNVARVPDANDFTEITRAFDAFQATVGRPTLIVVDSHIGYGSPHKQDTAAAHGEPLGDEEVRETKRFYDWPEDAQFLVPDGVRERFAEGIGERGERLRTEWDRLLVELRARAPVARAPDRPDAAPRAARRVGPRHPVVRRRREGHRHPQGVQPGSERDRRQRPVAARAGRPTSPTRPRCGWTRASRAATSSPTIAPAASSTSASASTSRRRSPTGSRCRSCGRRGRPT